MKILLTGATGFLGSHIAEALLANDVNLMITKRSMSSLNNCTSFIDHVQVINSDNPIWISQACSFSPDIIIHSAWTGVLSGNRYDWPVQLSNIDFMNSLLYIAEKSNVSKFIALGSQAEYGDFDGIVSENAGLFPVNSYGYVKSMVSRMVGSFCDLRGIDWYWLRVFSVYGERESNQWLIPGLLTNMLDNMAGMDLALGQQRYAYLYVKDFANAVMKVCSGKAPCGVYNLSSSTAIELRVLLEHLRDRLNPAFELRFGALPYRAGQPMLVQGDVSKFVKSFGHFENTPLNAGLEYTITYYKKQHESI